MTATPHRHQPAHAVRQQPALLTPWAGVILLAALAIAAVLTFRATGLNAAGLTPDRVRGYLLAFGWWAPLVYFVIYAQPLIPLPITVMALAAGLAFGLPAGVCWAAAAATVRACGQCLIARHFGRQTIGTLLKGRMERLDQRVDRHPFMTVLLVRLIPNVPFDLQNLALGCTRVPLGTFALATLLGMSPWIVAWVYFGNALSEPANLWRIVLASIALALLWLLQRRLRLKRVKT